MSQSDFGGAGVVAGYSFYSVGTNLVTTYPNSQFVWSFYQSLITGLGGPTPALADALSNGGIAIGA